MDGCRRVGCCSRSIGCNSTTIRCHTEEDPHQRRLPRPVGAEQSRPFSTQRGWAYVGLSRIADLQEGDVVFLSGADDEDGGVVSELAAVAAAKRDVARREEVAVRCGRHAGLSWEEIGTLLGVTKQTIHRKYRKVG